MISVKGKWAFISGASRGIGALTAVFMAERGCNLVLHSRDLGHTEQVLQTVRALGVEAYAVQADLARHEEVVGMLGDIEDRGTAVDIVCNNAGIQVPYRENFWQTPVADFDLCFRVNFTAVATICYHFMPKMIERGFGRVINTTSGIMEQPQQAAYSASKAALDKYTTDLGTAVEGSDLLINLTDPGWLRTDMGGPNAPGAPEDSLPGVVVGAFVDDGKSGRWFSAAEFVGMSLEEAVKKAGTM